MTYLLIEQSFADIQETFSFCSSLYLMYNFLCT